VFLEHKSTLNGAVNQNALTGATHLDPNELIPPTVIPPQSVNLGVDSTSTWNMRTSSTLNTLAVNPQAHINFPDPPAAFRTLVMNNLVGTGGIFGMHVDLGLIQGDLIHILKTSEGRHLLTFVNRNQGSDLPVNVALLVVRTADGGAGFRGQADGGTFRYFVVHGDGSSITPVRNDWYLVRGDEIKPPEITEPPPTKPDPTPAPTPLPLPTPAPTPPTTGGPAPTPTPPEFTPGDDLPLPPEPPPRRLSLADDLTPGANVGIGTFAATMPLFYADLDTLIQRMGELRLLAQAAPVPAPPTGISKEGGLSKEGGKEVVAPLPPVAPPSGGGVWFRGFGSGSHIDDQVSRSFHQNLGGFQIGADKRLVTRYGDLYLGGFAGYFYAHRDFQNQPFNNDSTGTTQAFSLGAYGTLIHPSGFYADLVVKYTQLWNDFDAPNVLSTLGLGPSATANYSIPTFGASLEIGKRWDFGHFFLEPQGQIEGAWAGGTDYTVSTGLRVSADSQTSLRGRLGVRAGYHFDWGAKAFEPYAKVSVINEFLGGDRVTTNQTSFFPTLSGVGIQAGGGLTARITDSFYVYGEYDYANSDKVRIPWAVDAGLRWVW
jgi:outer membrane autotransporter protein